MGTQLLVQTFIADIIDKSWPLLRNSWEIHLVNEAQAVST